jgi:predicted RNA-binding Zn-ribbon protein involved in translation (DUF1610 family)
MVTKVQMCPKCGSKDISRWTGAGESSMIYTCKFCGYKGPKVKEEFLK